MFSRSLPISNRISNRFIGDGEGQIGNNLTYNRRNIVKTSIKRLVACMPIFFCASQGVAYIMRITAGILLVSAWIEIGREITRTRTSIGASGKFLVSSPGLTDF
jgi:hypothetical protein